MLYIPEYGARDWEEQVFTILEIFLSLSDLVQDIGYVLHIFISSRDN